MPDDHLLEVGRIDRPHGLGGEVVVTLITDRTERVAPGSRLTTDAGQLTVENSRPFKGRFIVKFDALVDRKGAEAARGLALRAAPIDDPDALWVHELVGAPVVLPGGAAVGHVTAVEASAADDLLVLDTGHVVPVTFAQGWDADRRLVIDPPAGLLDVS